MEKQKSARKEVTPRNGSPSKGGSNSQKRRVNGKKAKAGKK